MVLIKCNYKAKKLNAKFIFSIFTLCREGHGGIQRPMNLDISSYENLFSRYAQSFCMVEDEHKSMLELKIIHTQAVLAHMRKLIKESSLEPYARPCLLSALFHDVARFPQFARWRTFKDSQSTNHGHLGVKVLKEQGWLDGENVRTRHQVLSAVGLHNRFSLPKGLPEDVRLITLALRDADKLDILRIMSEHFWVDAATNSAVTFYAKDDPKAWSQNILKAVSERHLASYNDIVYINDFRLLLGSWMHELHFETTKKILSKSGYLEIILQDLPADVEVQQAKAYLLGLLKNLA